MSFSASSDSGRRRIVCKERFPPTDCATVGRCSASPSSASIQVTTWSQLMMVMHHRWGGSLKGPDYHNLCDTIDLCDRLANCLFLPNVFIHAVMINAKKRSCLVICLGRPIALGATFYAPCLVICCPTCADLDYDTYDVQET